MAKKLLGRDQNGGSVGKQQTNNFLRLASRHPQAERGLACDLS